ncbi:MAG: magnesium transporter [Oscillospiraceae bacterium]|nr:magnesium transporter [Oscillospiraceae bacterium]
MTEITQTFEQTIEALIDAKKYATIRDVLTTLRPADIAIILESVDNAKLPLVFRLLPKELAAEAFVEMESDQQEVLIRSFSDAELKEVVDELYVDDAVDIVEEMPANVVSRILRQADPDMRKMINEILKYPEDSAGSIMTTEYVELRPDMSADDAIKRIRRTGIDKETIYTCYVTDKDRRLIGAITLKTLLLSDDETLVSDIMREDAVCVNTLEDQEEAAKALSKYDLQAIPVVDQESRLVGIITIDDAIDVIEEETTEDIEKMAAIMPTDKPYLKMTPVEIWKSRIPWLMLLMVSATFTGMIISSFETALAAQAALTAFIPMLMDTGGNSGSQASVTVIRSLSIGDIEFSDIFQVIWKELRVAILCALTLAVVSFAKIQLIDVLLLGHTSVTIGVTLVVCLTLALTIIAAKFVGCTLPLLAKKLGFDPAVMASPFITTIVDALSLLIYFAFASVILKI